MRQANFGRKARKENLTINSSNQVLDIMIFCVNIGCRKNKVIGNVLIVYSYE